MEREIADIESAITTIQTTVNNTTEWKGADADAYKIVLKNYASRIKRSSSWLKSLDRILESHAAALYRRAESNNTARNYR